MAELQVFVPQNNIQDAPEIQEAQQQVIPVINQALRTRQQTVLTLNDLAQNADFIYKNQGEGNRSASGLSMVGGLLTLGAGVATIMTAGAAAPILIGGLAGTGTAAGLGGGAWNIWNAKEKISRQEDLKELVRQVLRNDAVELEHFENICQRVMRGDMGEPNLIFREVHMVINGVGTVSTIFGAEMAIKVLMACVPGLGTFASLQATKIVSGSILVLNHLVKEVAEQASEEVAAEIARKAAQKATKEIYAGFTKKFAQKAAKEAAKAAAKESLELATKGGGEKVAEELTKKLAQKAAKKVAKKAARKAAEKAVEETMKTAAKVTGGIMAGFGGLTVAWEGWNLAEAHEQATSNESPTGRELRALAENMRLSLQGGANLPIQGQRN